MTADASKYEALYIRPTNGRADDQLRRNHSAQYISISGYEWMRLRKETPGLYESYVDLVPGEWTKIKVEVSGVKARLYVNGCSTARSGTERSQTRGQQWPVALWVGGGTESYFTNLRLSE